MAKLAEITINYKPKKQLAERPQITQSKDAEACFRQVWSDKIQHIEESYLMLLNRANEVLGYVKVSMGGVSHTMIDPKVIFQAALKANASGFILAHNHPSGNLKPSEQDIRLSSKIREAAKFMSIGYLDHLIITKEGYYSFADDGLV